MLPVLPIMKGKLSEDLITTVNEYTPEMFVDSGWSIKLVENGGEVVSFEPLLSDHTPKTVTFVSTFGSSSTIPVKVKTAPLYGTIESLKLETTGGGTIIMKMDQTMYLTLKFI